MSILKDGDRADLRPLDKALHDMKALIERCENQPVLCDLCGKELDGCDCMPWDDEDRRYAAVEDELQQRRMAGDL